MCYKNKNKQDLKSTRSGRFIVFCVWISISTYTICKVWAIFKKSLILFAIAMHDAITDFILLHPLSCMMQYFWQYLLKVVHHILKIVSSSLIVLHDFYSKHLCEWLTDWQQGWDGGYNKLTNGFIFFPFQARSQRRNIEYFKTQLRLTN